MPSTRTSEVFVANAEAQLLFRVALDDAIAMGRWDPALVDAYRAAERAVDALLVDVQGKVAQAELDAALDDGDHFLRPERHFAMGSWE